MFIKIMMCAAAAFLTPDGKPRQPDKLDWDIILKERCSVKHGLPMCVKSVTLWPTKRHRHVICKPPQYFTLPIQREKL